MLQKLKCYIIKGVPLVMLQDFLYLCTIKNN